jgi:hypothetical protein
MHYPRSEFSRRHAAFDRANVNTRTRWSEVDLVDLGHMLTRELPIQEIAIHLCRSPAEVRGKIAELGRASKDDPSREIIIVNEGLHRLGRDRNELPSASASLANTLTMARPCLCSGSTAERRRALWNRATDLSNRLVLRDA